MQTTDRMKTALLIALLLASTAGVQTAIAQTLQPAGLADLSSTNLIAAPAIEIADTAPRQAVALSWPLAATAELDPTAKPFTSRSKEYFVEVSAEELRQGVAIYTTRPGALVRLNPAAATAELGVAEKAAIEPLSLVLTDPVGKSFGAGSGMDLMVGPNQLEAAGAPFAESTSAFRLRGDLGAGTFTLRAEGLGAASASRYVMHVFDQHSAVELELRTSATNYLHGQTLSVEAALVRPDGKIRTRTIEGFVTSPAGRAWPLVFRAMPDGRYLATLELDALEPPAPGLWQVHASAQGRTSEHSVLRAGRTAFACAVPSARFSGTADIGVTAEAITVSLGIETASASRYEARGILYGTAADGLMRPAGIAHSAAWIEAGSGSLTLSFEAEVVSAVAAPFEIRDLRLIDQVTMGLLHRQERAVSTER